MKSTGIAVATTFTLTLSLLTGACGGEEPIIGSSTQAVSAADLCERFGICDPVDPGAPETTVHSDDLDHDGTAGVIAVNNKRAQDGKLTAEQCWAYFAQGLVDGRYCPPKPGVPTMPCIKTKTCPSMQSSSGAGADGCSSELSTVQGGYVSADCNCSTMFYSGDSQVAKSTVCCYSEGMTEGGEAFSCNSADWSVSGAVTTKEWDMMLPEAGDSHLY